MAEPDHENGSGPEEKKSAMDAKNAEFFGPTQICLMELSLLHLDGILEECDAGRHDHAHKLLKRYANWLRMILKRQEAIEHLNDIIEEAERDKDRPEDDHV